MSSLLHQRVNIEPDILANRAVQTHCLYTVFDYRHDCTLIPPTQCSQQERLLWISTQEPEDPIAVAASA